MAQHNESLVVIETEEAQRQRHAAAIQARNQEPLDRALRKGGVYRDAAGRYVDAHGHPLAPDDIAAYEAALAAREARVAGQMPRAVGVIAAPPTTSAPVAAQTDGASSDADAPAPAGDGATTDAPPAPAGDGATTDAPPAADASATDEPAKPAKGAKGVKG